MSTPHVAADSLAATDRIGELRGEIDACDAQLIELVRRETGVPRFGVRLPLAPMLAVAAVVEDVCQVLHLDPPIYRRRMDFFRSDSEFDTSRARRVLGWSPRVELQDGVRRTVEDYRRSGALG